jgi:hypothetical protein
MRRQGRGQSAPTGFRIRVRNRRGGPNERLEFFGVAAKTCADYGGAHGRTVSGRKYAAFGGRNKKEEFDDGPESCQADAGRQRQQPFFKVSGQKAVKILRAAARCRQRPRRHARVLRVVGDHSASKNEAVTDYRRGYRGRVHPGNPRPR